MGLNILNLTRENASRKEIRVGIVEPEDKKYILELLNNTVSIDEEKENAHKIAAFAELYNYKTVVIDYCKSSFANEIEIALLKLGIKPFYKKKKDGQIYLIEAIVTNEF